MNYTMVRRLILKDWYLQRWLILSSLAGGAISLAVIVAGGKAGFMLGLILLVTVLIAVGAMLTVNTTVLERREQTLAFVMALPISYREYTVAKILGILLIFLIPWLAFMASGFAVIELTAAVPHGLVPFVSIMGTEILASTCLIAAVGLITESQGWTIAAVMVGNLALNGLGYLFAHLGAIAKDMYGPVHPVEPGVVQRAAGGVRRHCAAAWPHILLSVEEEGLRLDFPRRRCVCPAPSGPAASLARLLFLESAQLRNPSRSFTKVA